MSLMKGEEEEEFSSVKIFEGLCVFVRLAKGPGFYTASWGVPLRMSHVRRVKNCAVDTTYSNEKYYHTQVEFT